jgi:hypothetical protein
MFYNRTYKLTLTPGSGAPIIWEQTEGEIGTAIDFKVEKTTTKEPNTCSLKIMNPSKNTVNTIQKGGQMMLEAGYGGDQGIVFAGGIDTTYYERNGPDSSITLSLNGRIGTKLPKNEIMTLETPKNQTAINLIKKITSYIVEQCPGLKVALPIVVGKLDHKYIKAETSQKDMWLLLDDKCKDAEAFYTIDNAILRIIPKKGYNSQQPVLVSAETGMIGYAKNVVEIGEDKKPRNGVDIETILNPAMTIGGSLKLTSADISQNKLYRIEYIEHSGNSHNGRWTTKVKAFTI